MEPIFHSIILWVKILSIPIASIVYRYVKKKPFFYKENPDANYQEKWRSGHACNIFQMFGGARNCLWFSILKDEIIICPHFPFNLLFLPEIWGCEHHIKGKEIISIDENPRLGGIVICFKKGIGVKKFRIYPKHKEIFVGFAKGILANHKKSISSSLVLDEEKHLCQPPHTKKRYVPKSIYQLMFIIFFFGVIGPIWWFVIPNLYKKDGLYTDLEQRNVKAVEKRIDSQEEVINRRFYGLNATPLHIAAGLGDIEMMDMLLRKGANIEVKGYRNLCEPIHLAAGKGHIKAVEFLLKNGAHIDAKDRDNETPLHDAAYNNQAEMIGYLVKHGANINAKSNCYHLTPLEEAVKFERAIAVRALLENGAKADLDALILRVQRDMEGAPLADETRKKEWTDVLEILREFKSRNAQPVNSADAKNRAAD